MTVKPKIPREQALAVAKEICTKLLPFVERCKIVGSIRRQKRFVGDIELLFVPKLVAKQQLLFGTGEMTDVADLNICKWEGEGYLSRRLNVNGGTTWGIQNKLAIHVASGIPVDFFSTTESKWWNALVIRTGGKRTNLQLTMAANKRGLTLHSYGDGFTDFTTGEKLVTHSEEDVFRIAGLTYVEPQFRV